MKKLILLSITAIFSINLYCQVYWTKHPDNPVLVPGSPGEWDDVRIALSSVIYYDSTYHMWYNGGEWADTVRTGHATSPDGLTWTKDTNNPVLDVGPVGAWDDHVAYYGDVLIIDSIFHMWYTGHTGQFGNRNLQIGHATSPDGINWTKDPNNPVLTSGPEGSWDDFWLGFCKVVYIDGTIHMWHSGSGGGDVITGHATSPDGVTWTKDTNNPVLDVGPETTWDDQGAWAGPVIFDGSTYQMWYDGGRNNHQKIGYATSEDGSQWEKYGTPVLRQGPPGSWDATQVFGASVLFDSTDYKYMMWYGGVPNAGLWGIGYAESDTCSDIVRPVLSAEDSLYQPNFIEVTSTEDGIIYLTPYANYYTLDAIRAACIDSVAAIANTTVQFLDQPNGSYRLYARDNRNNYSNPHKIVIWGVGVGTLESRVSSSVSIYPNPAASIVNIQTSKTGEFSIVIETLNGKEVSNGRFNGNTHQIDISSFQNGIYIITIRSKDFVTIEKIIKL